MGICFSFISGHEKFIQPSAGTRHLFAHHKRLRFQTRIVFVGGGGGWIADCASVVFTCHIPLFICLLVLLALWSGRAGLNPFTQLILGLHFVLRQRRRESSSLSPFYGNKSLPITTAVLKVLFPLIWDNLWEENPRRIANNDFAFCI